MIPYAGFGLVNGVPPAEIQPYSAGIALEDGVPWWYSEPVATPATVRPQPRPTNRGMGSDVEQWRSLVSRYFTDVDMALCVIRYESGGNSNAKNPRSSARGLFQILASLWAPHFGVSYEDLYDPETNVRLAAEIQATQGWRAWAVVWKGKC